MAAGEYVSVSSQADTERAALSRERKDLAQDAEKELKELTSIYAERGLDARLAKQVAEQLSAHDALAAHARRIGYFGSFQGASGTGCIGFGCHLFCRRRLAACDRHGRAANEINPDCFWGRPGFSCGLRHALGDYRRSADCARYGSRYLLGRLGHGVNRPGGHIGWNNRVKGESRNG